MSTPNGVNLMSISISSKTQEKWTLEISSDRRICLVNHKEICKDEKWWLK